jgi:hypothetical protein
VDLDDDPELVSGGTLVSACWSSMFVVLFGDCSALLPPGHTGDCDHSLTWGEFKSRKFGPGQLLVLS